MKNKFKLVLLLSFILVITGCVNSTVDYNELFKTKIYDNYTYKTEDSTQEFTNVLVLTANKKFKSAKFELNEELLPENVEVFDYKIKLKNKKVIEVKNITKYIEKDEPVFIIQGVNKDKLKNIKITLKSKMILALLIENLLVIIYNFVNNFGIAIILLTILIKLVLFPLTLKQDKSMKEMKKIQPEIEKLREKYKDNPQELNKATMELYQEHKVNPFGGCLPALLQLPILWTLFSVLRSDSLTTVIPFDAHLLFWKLVEKDPFFILPILNGIVMFVQQKYMSAGNDAATNSQMKMMTYTMPIMIVFISLQMPSGLQLYWLTSSFIGLLQQLIIMNKGVEKSAKNS